jgi:glycosyltransferase involved in cell wall biosynthesis
VATTHLLDGLAACDALDVSVFAKGLAAHDLDARLPKDVVHRQRRLPPRLLDVGWRSLGWPPIDRAIGRPDVVHSLGDLVPPVRHGAQVITIHDAAPLIDPSLADPASLRGWPSIVRAVRRGATVHCTTAAVADVVAEGLGVDRGRIAVIPWGIPPLSTRESVEVEDLVPRGVERYIVVLGVDGPRKGIPDVLAAFDQLADDDPHLGLVIIGRRGEGSPPRVVRHGDRVASIGPLSAGVTRTLLANAHVLAMASLLEGFGFPALQAMALRVPVVASNLAPLREVLGDAALYTEVSSPSSLAHALDAVLSNEALRRDLTIRGRARSLQFSWTATANAMADLYASVAKSPGG